MSTFIPVMSLINSSGPDTRRASIWVPTISVLRVEDLADAVSLPVLNRAGCYFAIGLPDAGDQRPYVMCGEGANVGRRLSQKIRDSDRAWHFVIIFGCEQPGWYAAAVKHLEWRFSGLLDATPHFDFVIGTAPRRDFVSDAERRALDVYVLEARRLLVAMGHHFLEPVPVLAPRATEEKIAPAAHPFGFDALLTPHLSGSGYGRTTPVASSPDPAAIDGVPGAGLRAGDPVGTRYRLAYGDLRAIAIKLPEGALLVRQGSEVSAAEITTLPSYIRKHRATLLATGAFAPHPSDRTRFVLTHDVSFESPSLAAKCTTGSSQGAGAVWRIGAADTLPMT